MQYSNMIQQKEKKYYTSDLENINAADGLRKRIEYLENLRNTLIAYKGSIKDSSLSIMADMKIDGLMPVIETEIEWCKRDLNRFLPEGVYVLRQNHAWFKAGTKIQRVIDENESTINDYDHSICDKCMFGKMPCLNINSYYGCYRRKWHDGNESKENGELIKSGYFVLYNEDKNEN